MILPHLMPWIDFQNGSTVIIQTSFIIRKNVPHPVWPITDIEI